MCNFILYIIQTFNSANGLFQFNFITLLTLLIKTSQIFVDVLMLYKYYIVYAYEFNLLLA